ncbi:hypothetical protein IE81DRAFT_210325 [Ceraceosorus guamensis]|uniref:Uncharacterized protein n=1 Tax=Ceraceosorus guamensis TaxID=1522189 RepID=A0A316WCK4_9BASI|nr:hypothetical protein IE81DRAFT_210325 [Ceraceosorus guamensis]PWN45265.1 hypothetical protein IE81DRAFT_210325 [Ceraceosorus guamensis]
MAAKGPASAAGYPPIAFTPTHHHAKNGECPKQHARQESRTRRGHSQLATVRSDDTTHRRQLLHISMKQLQLVVLTRTRSAWLTLLGASVSGWIYPKAHLHAIGPTIDSCLTFSDDQVIQALIPDCQHATSRAKQSRT